MIYMNYATAFHDPKLQEMTTKEIDEVNGGVVFLAPLVWVAVVYVAVNMAAGAIDGASGNEKQT